jgi:hypothetical protein
MAVSIFKELLMKKVIYKILHRKNIIKKDIEGRFPISFKIKLKMWKQGFLAEKFVLYNLSQNNWMEFLSDYHAKQAKWVNDPYNVVLDNKLIFHCVVRKAIRVPENYALIKKGRIHPINRERTITNFEQLVKYIKKKPIVLKPVSGGGGKNVLLIDHQNKLLVCNKIPSDEQKLKERIESMDEVLITEFIEQGRFPKSLHPESANTMRIVTLRDVDTDKPFIARAVQRIGNQKTAPQDNFTKGGMSSMIDLESGILSPAATHPKSSTLKWYDSHPGTGVSITGQQVPGWDQIKRAIIEAAEELPFLKCIGWDILLAESGPVALEGNSHPDPDVLQCHGPLLQNERVLRFYQHYGVVK